MSNVKLVGITQPTMVNSSMDNAEDLIAYCARVSNPANQDNPDSERLLKYLVKNKHWSPFEMVHIVMEIHATRDIGRQILRHRSFSFQEFCVDENTLITTLEKNGSAKKVRIADLYKRQQSHQYSKMSDWLVRVFDENTKTFVARKVKEVFETGVKPVFEVMLENGKKITATEDHKLLTFDGFKRIADLSIADDFVGCNGVPVHQSKEWLESAKRQSIDCGAGLSFIASAAGVKPVTVSKWLRKYGLQFSKKEVAVYTNVWNKGLPKEQQPRYNKPTNVQTRTKQSASAKKSAESNLWTSGNSSSDVLPWRRRVVQVCKGYHLQLLVKQDFKCAITGASIDKNNSEVDHILPVYLYPNLAFEESNLQVLSKDAHREKSKKESLESKYTTKHSKIKSITYVGERQTYDLEVDHDSHNYIGNGIVTHNSQRYAEVQNFAPNRETRRQDQKNRQNSIELDDGDEDSELKHMWNEWQDQIKADANEAYEWAIKNGIAKEQARVVLPEGLTMSRMYMSGSLRSWITYIALREKNGSQKEHKLIALECKKIISENFPSVAAALGGAEQEWII
jgi:thymidylate synthase ThyX/5-methylcytosine-specific restriction endonuclease McrA